MHGREAYEQSEKVESISDQHFVFIVLARDDRLLIQDHTLEGLLIVDPIQKTILVVAIHLDEVGHCPSYFILIISVSCRLFEGFVEAG